MSCCELYTHLISTRGLRGGKTKNKKKFVVPSQCLLGKTKLDLLAAVGRTVTCFSLSMADWSSINAGLSAKPVWWCQCFGTKNKNKTKNKNQNLKSAESHSECSLHTSNKRLFVWRSSAARAVKGSNSHKPFPLTNLLHDLSTRGLQTQNDSPSSPWSG